MLHAWINFQGVWGMRFLMIGKVLAVGAVILLLSVVMLRIDGLVQERRGRQAEAVRSVAQSHAGSQTLLGPLLVRQCVEEWDKLVVDDKQQRRTEPARREFTLSATPSALDVQAATGQDTRYRGLFKVNGYTGSATLQARWADLAPLRPTPTQARSRLHCDAPAVLLALSDVRGIRRAELKADGAALPVQAGTGHPRYPRGLHASLPAARVDAADAAVLAVQLQLDFIGTARLALVPAAGDTHWVLRSDWPHPSFAGRFLPTQRTVDEAGFRAEWRVSALASSAAAEVQRGAELCVLQDGGSDDDNLAEPPASTPNASCLETMAVSFIDPVNPYSLADRAIKYALLFIVLTFVAVGLVELLSGQRVHPVQYALVGLALALFFLLLLSLSEHLPFDVAYAAASAACAALLGHYAAHMLGQRRAGWGFGGCIAALYGLLWVLLQREQTALVIGSLLLFAALAGVMVTTRRIDWYHTLARPAAPGSLALGDEGHPPP